MYRCTGRTAPWLELDGHHSGKFSLTFGHPNKAKIINPWCFLSLSKHVSWFRLTSSYLSTTRYSSAKLKAATKHPRDYGHMCAVYINKFLSFKLLCKETKMREKTYNRDDLIEQAKAHVIIRLLLFFLLFFFLLFLLGFLLCLGSWCGGSTFSGRCSGSCCSRCSFTVQKGEMGFTTAQ